MFCSRSRSSKEWCSSSLNLGRLYCFPVPSVNYALCEPPLFSLCPNQKLSSVPSVLWRRCSLEHKLCGAEEAEVLVASYRFFQLNIDLLLDGWRCSCCQACNRILVHLRCLGFDAVLHIISHAVFFLRLWTCFWCSSGLLRWLMMPSVSYTDTRERWHCLLNWFLQVKREMKRILSYTPKRLEISNDFLTGKSLPFIGLQCSFLVVFFLLPSVNCT